MKKFIIAAIISFLLGFLISSLVVKRPSKPADVMDKGDTGENTPALVQPGTTPQKTDTEPSAASGKASLPPADEARSESGAPSEREPTKTLTVEGNTLTVTSQIPGNTVIISSATLGKDTWLVVREDVSGEPGNILGAGRFRAGTSSGEIELLRGTVEGGMYYIVLNSDNGDSEFEYKTDDLPLKDSNGNMVKVQFKATSSPRDEATAGECVVTGCSGQLCANKEVEVASTCEFKPEYSCYNTAVCERQSSGECSWTPTEELNNCLDKYQ